MEEFSPSRTSAGALLNAAELGTATNSGSVLLEEKEKTHALGTYHERVPLSLFLLGIKALTLIFTLAMTLFLLALAGG